MLVSRPTGLPQGFSKSTSCQLQRVTRLRPLGVPSSPRPLLVPEGACCPVSEPHPHCVAHGPSSSSRTARAP
eukprot:3668919-Alexandrium_andersonii.AAC.1